jgi:hypothetical protein
LHKVLLQSENEHLLYLVKAGESKIDQSFDILFSAALYALYLRLVELDLSGPQVEAVQISESCFKNCDLHDSLNKVETIALNWFPSPPKLDWSTIHYIFGHVCTSTLQFFLNWKLCVFR